MACVCKLQCKAVRVQSCQDLGKLCAVVALAPVLPSIFLARVPPTAGGAASLAQRHAVVLGLKAFVLSTPYDVPGVGAASQLAVPGHRKPLVLG